MPLTQMNNITIQNITDIANITGDPVEILININQTVYNGWFFFILLWLIAVILYIKAQVKEDQPMVNAMNVMAIVTVLSFVLRVVYVVRDGVEVGLLTDFQMWMFPLVAIIAAVIVRFTSE